MDGEDILRFLPKGFVEAYHGLLAATFGEGIGQSPGYNPGPVETAGCVDGGRDFTSRVPLRATADGAGEVRRSVDRRLRKLGREMQGYLEDGAKQVKPEGKCYRCGRFGDSDWAYCGWCGAPVGGAILYRCECGPEIHQGTRTALISCARTRGELPDDVEDSKVFIEWIIPDVNLAGSVKK